MRMPKPFHLAFFDDGVLMAEHMICHKIADPNIRLQGGAFVKVGTVTYSQGDARDLTKGNRGWL